MSAHQLRIVSWNIEHGRRIGEAIAALESAADLAGADVVLLQEMDDDGTAQISAALDLHSVYLPGSTHSVTGRPFGNAVLSRWPLTAAEELELPHRSRIQGERRIAVGTSVDYQDDTLELWSVHFEVSTLTHRRQVDQYNALSQRLGATGASAIVGGDANTASSRSREALTRAMEASGLLRAPTGSSFERFRRRWILDHLFVRGFDIVDAGVETQHEASDHDPIWITIAR